MYSYTSLAKAVVTLALGFSAYANGTQPILFNPNGTGSSGALTVSTFDWSPGNAVQIDGNPAGGVILTPVPTKPVFFTHGRLAGLLDLDGNIILGMPTGVEFTFVAGFPEIATGADPAAKTNVFALDPSPPLDTPNYFEIWVGIPPNANMLAGTGFNDYSSDTTSHRILFGIVTAADGNFVQTGCSPTPLDQSPDGINQYPLTQTVCGSGGTQLSVNIISVDVNYFPGVTPDIIDTVKVFFNTNLVTPFRQAEPSGLFVDDDAGADGRSPPTPADQIAPVLGAVNGQLQYTDSLDFQSQADANHSFELGEAPPGGGCRVTYGGNDRNGNIDLTKFGQACSSDKGNKQNCYTFGGQVGAPTASNALGGPFGEHTHHNVSGPAGDFVFHAGTKSALKSSRITATACKDPGACRQAVANAGFKQIDFEGTGSFRTLDAVAKAYLAANAGHPVLPDNQDTRIYYFRADMDDTGEPGNKPAKKQSNIKACSAFLSADQNNPLSTYDPLLSDSASCGACADVYQFYICKDENRCEQKDAIYAISGFLTGGNIQLHRIIK